MTRKSLQIVLTLVVAASSMIAGAQSAFACEVARPPLNPNTTQPTNALSGQTVYWQRYSTPVHLDGNGNLDFSGIKASILNVDVVVGEHYDTNQTLRPNQSTTAYITLTDTEGGFVNFGWRQDYAGNRNIFWNGQDAAGVGVHYKADTAADAVGTFTTFQISYNPGTSVVTLYLNGNTNPKMSRTIGFEPRFARAVTQVEGYASQMPGERNKNEQFTNVNMWWPNKTSTNGGGWKDFNGVVDPDVWVEGVKASGATSPNYLPGVEAFSTSNSFNVWDNLCIDS